MAGLDPTASANPSLIASLLQGALPAGAAGWLNPQTGATPGTFSSSPTQDATRLAYAQQLMQQGSDTSPVRSTWQGLARMAQGLVGGLDAAGVRQDQANGQASWQAAMARGLGQSTADVDIPRTSPGFSTPAPSAADQAQDDEQDGVAPGAALSYAPSPSASPAAAAIGAALAGQSGASAAPSFGRPGLPTFAAGVGSPTGVSPNAQAALNLYEQKGLSPVAAAALVGGFAAESGKGLNTGAVARGDGTDGSNSVGIGQWNGNRAAGLMQFAQANGLNPADLNTQLQYSWSELNGPEHGTLDALQAAGYDPTKATAAALGYERPKGWSPQNPLAAVSAPQRIAATNALTASAGGAIPPLRGGGFGPIATGQSAPIPPALPPIPAGGGVAASSTGQPVATDAQGNALGPNGAPTALSFSPAPGMAGAAGQQAITGATGPASTTGAQQPYGSVPINIGGKMLTRQQAEDTDGLDHTDYDDAAVKMGMKPTPFVDGAPVTQAGASGPSPASSVVTGAPAAAPQPTHIANDPATNVDRRDAGLSPLPPTTPIGQGTAQGSGASAPSASSYFTSVDGSPVGAAKTPVLDKGALLALLSNPYTPAGVQTMAVSMLEQAAKSENWQTLKDADNSLWQRNALTGEMKLIQDNTGGKDKWSVVKGPGDVPLYEFNSSTGKTQALPGGQGTLPGYRPMTAQEKQAYGVPADSAAYIGPDGKPAAIGGGTTVNVGNEQTSYDKVLADALGKSHAALASGVEDAQGRLRDIHAMQGALDAIQRNGGTSGYGQSQLVQLQSAINSGANALGIDQPFDISDKEFLTKFNRTLAGAQAKGVSGARVTNFEMSNFLKANPGLEISPQGNRRLLGIMGQIDQRNVDVGNAIRNATAQAIAGGRKIDPTTVQGIISNYDQGHHITDPLTGQDLTQSAAVPDLQQPPASAQSTGPSNPAAVLGEARAALAKGAPRAAVIQRLRSMNIDPAGL